MSANIIDLRQAAQQPELDFTTMTEAEVQAYRHMVLEEYNHKSVLLHRQIQAVSRALARKPRRPHE